ncbi:MAG: S-layer homology domain-containing protein, partial [Clostridia bacterium]|nr:S-layer homology domain-containing protein [Clostridia bacterium]
YNLSDGELEFADKELVADYAYESVSSLSNLKIVNGVGDNMFDPQGIATRAQAAVIINNAMEQ